MKLSRTACYAIQAVVYLAGQDKDQTIIGHRAAKTLGIPVGFLLRILVMLSRSHILWSLKGPKGGYRLARPAKEITLLDVIEAVDGRIQGRVLIPGHEATAVDRRLETICEEAAAATRRHFQKVRISELAGKTK